MRVVVLDSHASLSRLGLNNAHNLENQKSHHEGRSREVEVEVQVFPAPVNVRK